MPTPTLTAESDKAIESSSLNKLRGLAAGLCVDAGIRVESEEGPHWYYDHSRRTIVVPSRDIRSRGVHYCAGVLAHEVGHFFITRYHHFVQAFTFPSSKILLHLLNCLEDPRVNQWIKARYPGARAWYGLMVEDFLEPDKLGVPEVLSFGIECHAEEMHGWQARAEGALPARVELALMATRLVRQASASCLPSLIPDAVLFDDHLIRQASETLSGRMEPVELTGVPSNPMNPRELEVLVQQARALTLIRDGVCEEAAKLLQSDCARLGWHLLKQGMLSDLMAISRGKGPQVIRQKLVKEVLPAMKAVPNPPTTWVPDQNQTKALIKVLELFLENAQQLGTVRVLGSSAVGDRHGSRSAGAGGAGGRAGASKIDVKCLENPAPDLSKSHGEGVEKLRRMVEEGLNPHRLRRHHGAFASGYKLSMREAMRMDAEPERYHRLWQRRIRPTKPDAAFGLLVDLSGSMRGEKIKAAMAGTLLLAETLAKLEVPCLIHGFQDKLIPITGWDGGYSVEVRKRIIAMQLEVTDSRPGGNNQMRYNDDGPCLNEFARLVSSHPAAERFLVVVSDGGPAGSRSTEQDLVRAVETISREKIIRLIGLGLGPNTEHVRKFYPSSIANVSLENFPSQIGGLILEACGVICRPSTSRNPSQGN